MLRFVLTKISVIYMYYIMREMIWYTEA